MPTAQKTTMTWTEFPDDGPPAREPTLSDHQFHNMAKALGWPGTEKGLMAGLEALRDGISRPDKDGEDIRDP